MIMMKFGGKLCVTSNLKDSIDIYRKKSILFSKLYEYECKLFLTFVCFVFFSFVFYIEHNQ